MVALPFCDYFDPLVDDPVYWRHLVDRIQEERCTFTIRPLHNDVGLLDKRLELVKRAKWHGRCLCDDEEAIWQSLHSSARRAIRKAQNQHIEVQAAQSKADLRAFYELHLNIRKHKYRMIAQPYAFFENIWEQFIETGKGQLLLARCQGEIAAGVLLLAWRGHLFYKFNASSPQHLQARPNDILLWESLCYGKAQQLTYFDFGLSDWDQEGLIQYKRKYAQEEKTISFLRYDPGVASSPDEQALGKLLPQLTDLFTEQTVPNTITERAGELLYRYFC
jgi:CelD/BcsL family acetyltransferase involved in cellulose biosynthesis